MWLAIVYKSCTWYIRSSRYPKYFIYRGLSYNCGISYFRIERFQSIYFISISTFVFHYYFKLHNHTGRCRSSPWSSVCCLRVVERWGDGSLRDTSPPPWGIAVGCLLSIFSCSSRRLSYVNPAHLATSNENSFSICILNCF